MRAIVCFVFEPCHASLRPVSLWLSLWSLQITCASFDTLEVPPSPPRKLLLLGYATGFQAWDLTAASSVREILSRRDGAPVVSLHIVPLPLHQPPPPTSPSDTHLSGAHPLLCTVLRNPQAPHDDQFLGPFADPEEELGALGIPPGVAGKYPQVHPQFSGGGPAAAVLRFYSLRSHAFVHELPFSTPVVGLRCSARVLAVALRSQVRDLPTGPSFVHRPHRFTGISVKPHLTWVSFVTSWRLPVSWIPDGISLAHRRIFESSHVALHLTDQSLLASFQRPDSASLSCGQSILGVCVTRGRGEGGHWGARAVQC